MELFFEANQLTPSTPEWVALGKPKLYKKCFDKMLPRTRVTIWDECAFGGIRIQVGDHISEGKDEVECEEYLARGYYFTAGPTRLYQRIA